MVYSVAPPLGNRVSIRPFLSVSKGKGAVTQVDGYPARVNQLATLARFVPRGLDRFAALAHSSPHTAPRRAAPPPKRRDAEADRSLASFPLAGSYSPPAAGNRTGFPAPPQCLHKPG